jgi:hypothetical protein
MRNRSFAVLLLAVVAPTLFADLSVIVDSQARPEYVHRGMTYIEAIRGREYSLRIANPTPYRVAVALAVDGLNTIDAKHTDGWNASKWVLEPYQSTEISGWQVSDRSARKFFFTGERRSYGAALGKTENLGVIEAIFYRERVRPVAGMMAPRAEAQQKSAVEDDDYAATGMGGRMRHEVEQVEMELDPQPIASVRIRYEFRPQLVRLGVFGKDPLQRREGASGFCPESN